MTDRTALEPIVAPLPLVAILRGLTPENAPAIGGVLVEAGFRVIGQHAPDHQSAQAVADEMQRLAGGVAAEPGQCSGVEGQIPPYRMVVELIGLEPTAPEAAPDEGHFEPRHPEPVYENTGGLLQGWSGPVVSHLILA